MRLFCLYSTHLESMFAGRVSCCQGRPSQADNTADSHNAPSALLRHVRQHLLGDGDRTQEVELHQGLIHVNACLHTERALASAAIVNEDINLARHGKLDGTGEKENLMSMERILWLHIHSRICTMMIESTKIK